MVKQTLDRSSGREFAEGCLILGQTYDSGLNVGSFDSDYGSRFVRKEGIPIALVIQNISNGLLIAI